jgi:hypothetical protein
MPEPLPEAEESDDMLAIAKKGSSNTKWVPVFDV